MSETELKFQVAAARLPAVRRAVATGTAETLRLQARYFDTPDRRLARAGLALRLRKEGGAWVQTLKSAGDGVMQRGEHEVVLAGDDAPSLDLARHSGAPQGAALVQALAGAASPLAETFATDIRRMRRRVRAGAGAVLEVALDEGHIRAAGRSLPVCELELELLQGHPAALPRLAAGWVRRHGLWLDPRSKAERGDRLARGATGKPVTARQPQLDAAMLPAAAVRAMLASALRQVLANACEVAQGQGEPEHLHQCRVGLRRLRSVLRDFGPLSTELPPEDAQRWQEQLRAILGTLGAARDRDALRESLLPQLQAAGAPWAELPPADEAAPDPAALLASAGTTLLWLELLAHLHASPPELAHRPPPLRDALAAVLSRLHRQVSGDAAGFAGLEEEAQHRTRKRLKRLRYGAEFASSLYPAEAVARYIGVLRQAQDALGDAQDLAVARALFEPQVEREPRAWFILGWLSARRPVVVAECAGRLERLAEETPFWIQHAARR